MSATKRSANLSAREEKDLKKFTTFFALKTIQVIVQSRSGSKVETKSKVHSEGLDWFNIAIPDNLSIKSQVRKLLAQDVPSINQPLTIDITLETNEGDKMVLESWSLSFTDKRDPHAKVHYAVYSRMGLVLKSIICITRSVPAYRIARRQTCSDYKVLSSIYVGDGKGRLSSLGQDFQTMQIGLVPTPVGSLGVSVAYRTNLAMSVQQLNTSDISSPIKVADNHFSQSPQRQMPAAAVPKLPSIVQSESSTVNASQEMWSSLLSSSPSAANSAAGEKMAPSTSNEEKSSETIPAPASTSESSTSRSEDISSLSSQPVSIDSHLGAFASHSPLPEQLGIDLVPEETPFESLLYAASRPKEGEADETDGNPGAASDDRKESASGSEVPGSDSQVSDKSSSSQTSDVDDFVMVDLHPAFAKSDSSSDLANFYLAFQSAPELELFKDQPTLGEVLDKHIPEQLQLYEKNVKEFDALVESLRVDDDDGTDSG